MASPASPHAPDEGLAPDLVGCVLCGGASRRMARDKAQVELDGRTLLDRALGAFEGLTGRVLLATGAAPRYAGTGLPCVLDRTPDGGPLAGVEAGLAWMVEHGLERGTLLVLACDMPFVTPAVFRALLEGSDGAGVSLARGPRGVEPLLGLYRPRVLPAVRSALAAGERRMVGFHHGHGPVRVVTLPLTELAGELGRAIENVNTPDELARLSAGASAALRGRSA